MKSQTTQLIQQEILNFEHPSPKSLHNALSDGLEILAKIKRDGVKVLDEAAFLERFVRDYLAQKFTPCMFDGNKAMSELYWRIIEGK